MLTVGLSILLRGIAQTRKAADKWRDTQHFPRQIAVNPLNARGNPVRALLAQTDCSWSKAFSAISMSASFLRDRTFEDTTPTGGRAGR